MRARCAERGERVVQFYELALATLQSQLHAHDRAVGLELCERQVQHAVRFVPRVTAHEVRGHVVGGAERGAEHERLARREIGNLLERDERRPKHHSLTNGIDATPTCSSGELRVLTRREELMRVTGELGQLLDDHGARWHVDAQCQCLGREHDLDEALGEQVLDGLLERRDHACVVRSDALLEPEQPLVVTEHCEVALGQRCGTCIDDLSDARPLIGRGEANTCVDAEAHCVIASRATEDEIDNRQEALLAETIDHVDARRRREHAARAPARVAPLVIVGIEPVTFRVRSAVEQRRYEVESVGTPVGRAIEVHELDRSRVFDDHGGRPSHCSDPLGELGSIRHGGREAHEPDALGEVHDDLLPYRPAVCVLEVVDLVEHHVAQIVERRGLRVDHVA
ncbi:unannotated protein [freshwater metagenome]|uniref:Unannotated protein n=1 Tax=freshwater metagenome TaxID=449393 RepID=A0A6J7AMR0_9ZZZZ